MKTKTKKTIKRASHKQTIIKWLRLAPLVFIITLLTGLYIQSETKHLEATLKGNTAPKTTLNVKAETAHDQTIKASPTKGKQPAIKLNQWTNTK